MIDKKPGSRGVVDSIARLRELRYMTKGAGAKPQRPAPAIAMGRIQDAPDRVYPLTKKTTVDQLRADVAKVAVKPKKRKKAKKRSRK